MRKFLLLLALLAAGCAAPSREPLPAVPPPEPRPPVVAGPFESWEVVSSLLVVRVYRDGPMQKLGHNHLITSDALDGEIQLREPLTQSGFDLALPLESLLVDDPDARSGAGEDFSAPVPATDREATRQNMLGEAVLAVARQPVLRVTAEELSGEAGAYQARVRIGLRGEERVITAPFSVTVEGSRLSAHANFRLSHADIGLVPFTAALGALRVRDDFEVDLRLEARPAS
ncbi:MAG: hypothetical protein WD944_04245 [Steroidobacteraceae bacterium]